MVFMFIGKVAIVVCSSNNPYKLFQFSSSFILLRLSEESLPHHGLLEVIYESHPMWSELILMCKGSIDCFFDNFSLIAHAFGLISDILLQLSVVDVHVLAAIFFQSFHLLNTEMLMEQGYR